MSHRVKPAKKKPHLVEYRSKPSNNYSYSSNYYQSHNSTSLQKYDNYSNANSTVAKGSDKGVIDYDFLYESVENSSLIGCGTGSVFEDCFEKEEAIKLLKENRILTPEDAIFYFAEFDDYTREDVDESIALDNQLEEELNEVLDFNDDEPSIDYDSFNGYTKEEVDEMIWFFDSNYNE